MRADANKKPNGRWGVGRRGSSRGLRVLGMAGLFFTLVSGRRDDAQQAISAPASASAQTPSAAPASAAQTEKPVVLTAQMIVQFKAQGYSDGQLLELLHTHPNTIYVNSSAELMQGHTEYHLSTPVLVAMCGVSKSPNAQQALREYLAAVKDESATRPSPAVSAAGPAVGPSASRGLGNQDILDMVQQKVPDATIVKIIQSSATHFDLYTTPDFDNVVRHGTSMTVLHAMMAAAGPRAQTAAQQYDRDVKKRTADATQAESERIRNTRAEIVKQCPGCVSIIVYEYDKGKLTPGVYPDRVLKSIDKYGSLEYAKEHHIFLTNDLALADYEINWSVDESELHMSRTEYSSGTSSTGEIVNVGHSEPYSLTQTYYFMAIRDLKAPAKSPAIYKTQHANVGMWGTHKADLDCWKDIEKELGKIAAQHKN